MPNFNCLAIFDIVRISEELVNNGFLFYKYILNLFKGIYARSNNY